MNKELTEHKLHFSYSGNSKDNDLTILAHLIEGRDDTAENRKLFSDHQEKTAKDFDWTTIEWHGTIYPRWVLLDMYRLLENDNSLLKVLVGSETDLLALPPLNYVLGLQTT